MPFLEPAWQKMRFGYETPRQEDTLGTARQRQIGSLRWLIVGIIALGIFGASLPYNGRLKHVYSTKQTYQSRNTDGSRRVCIVMHNTNDTAMFNSPEFGSNANHEKYAAAHGYPFRFSTQPYVDWSQRGIKNGWVKSSGEHGYNKLIQLQDAVLHGIQTNEWESAHIPQDGDTWIVNPSIELESYLPPEAMWDKHPAPYFIAAPDLNGFNDGTFFMRANYWSFSFLAQTFADLYQPIDAARAQGYSDQRSICRALLNDKTAASHFYRCPQRWFNLYPEILDDPESDHEIVEETLQVHLVDRLHRDEELFKTNMENVEHGWQRAFTETLQLRPELDPNSDGAIYQASVDALPCNRIAKKNAAKYWAKEAVSGIDGLAWLDID